MHQLKVGDRVKFTKKVIADTGNNQRIIAMRGLILSLNDKIVEVNTYGTWRDDRGNSIRLVHLNNIELDRRI